MPDVIPPVHDDPVTPDAPSTVDAAAAALASHKKDCRATPPEMLGNPFCDICVTLTAAWRQALRRGSVDYGSAGGQMTAEEPASHPVRQ